MIESVHRLSVWCVICLLFVPVARAEQDSKNVLAFVNMFNGNVQVAQDFAEQSQAAAVGTKLYAGSQFVVAPGANAEIFVVGKGLLHLEASTKVVFAKGPSVQILSGGLRAVLTEAMNFQTSSGVVKGSSGRFVVEASQRGTTFYALSGEVKTAQGRLARSGQSITAKGAQATKVKEVDFKKLFSLDNKFNFPINPKQTPHVVTHQYWAALLARNLNYELPRGWANYPPQAYIDLLTGIAADDIYAVDNVNVAYKENMAIGEDAIGNPAIVAKKGPIIVYFDLPISADGDFSVIANSEGAQQYWTFEGYQTVLSPASYAARDSLIGPVNLKKGIYRLGVSVPQGGKISTFRPEGPYQSIAPGSGWQKDSILTYKDMVQTIALVRGLSESAAREVVSARVSKGISEGNQHVYNVDLNSRGLYVISLSSGRDWKLDDTLRGSTSFGPLYLESGTHRLVGDSKADVTVEQVEDDFDIFADDLKESGFILRDAGGAVKGGDAILNAALLRSEDEEIEIIQVSGTVDDQDAIVFTSRTPVSPVLPSSL